MDANAQKWKMQLQSVQNESFPLSNVQILDVLVAIGNLKNDNDNDLIEWKVSFPKKPWCRVCREVKH